MSVPINKIYMDHFDDLYGMAYKVDELKKLERMNKVYGLKFNPQDAKNVNNSKMEEISGIGNQHLNKQKPARRHKEQH